MELGDGTVDPRLLERGGHDVCVCWFDTLEYSEAEFIKSMNAYVDGSFVCERLGKVNGCAYYGVVAMKSRGGDTAFLTHDASVAVAFEYPIGDEDGEHFFKRIMGIFSRSAVEALEGFSVAEILT